MLLNQNATRWLPPGGDDGRALPRSTFAAARTGAAATQRSTGSCGLGVERRPAEIQLAQGQHLDVAERAIVSRFECCMSLGPRARG